MDFAGPFIVRAAQPTKVWIALFTCYVTRAVHLETVSNQTTIAFINCLKRFTARRGLPKRFISDNGKTFKSAAKYLDKVFKDEAVQKYLSGHGIHWQFNVELAPWWGGAFERMVRSTKRCLRKMIGRAHFSHEELNTALAEIEAVLNSRPLGYYSGEDTEEPITPSHLVVGRRILSLPDHLDHMVELDDEEYTLDHNKVTKRVKHINNVLNHFWKRWQTEYLNDLREVHAHSARRNPVNRASPTISVGDVVIVKDEHLPRGQWKLGVVQEVATGRDNQVRAATVKVASSGRQHSTLKRPIQLLYPLEIRSEFTYAAAPTKPSVSDKSSTPERPQSAPTSRPAQSDTEVTRRPRRAAAIKADMRRREWVAELDNY